MRKRISQALFAVFLLLWVLPAAADSAKEMLAAGRIDEAITALNGRLSSAPTDAESSNLLCRSYFALEEWDRAESACKRAVALDPNNSRFHLWLGRVYGEKADRASFVSATSLAGKTRNEFQRAVQLDPNDADARLDLAEYYFEAPGIVGGGQDKAREQAKLIGKINAAKEHWVYGRIAEKNKDWSTAEREYRQMVESGKGDAEGWLNLGFFYRNRKRYSDMEQAFAKMNQAPMPHREVLVEAANSLLRTDRSLPFAIELLRRYFAEGPVEERPAFKAHYLLGQLLEKQGEKASAAEQYRASLALARNFGLAKQALNRVAP
jgi:cytochrome c-type biogenesis protein CcmH/NrfG